MSTLPVLTISPYAVKKRKTAPLWKLFMSRSLITKTLLKQAQAYQSKNLILVLPKGKMGTKILQTIKKNNQKYGLDITSTIQLKGNEKSEQWDEISKQIIQKK